MIETAELEVIKAKVKEKGWAVYKDASLVEIAHEARKEYFNNFEKIPMRSSGFSYKELQAGAIRKKNISSANGVGESYAQVLQTTYYPVQNPYVWTKKMFDFQIVARNRLVGLSDWYGDNPPTDQYWNACRIHHYPRGGGFMVEHRDTHFPKIIGDMHYLQTLFLMSIKGTDFKTGGGFIRTNEGEFIDLEDQGGMGALIFFDGRIQHGVRDVDSDSDFSLSAQTGRLVAIAGQYEYREA